MKTMNKNTVEAIVRLIEEADKKENVFPEYKHNVATMIVSENGEIASPIDLAVWGEDAEALRLVTILSNSTSGFYQTNELDNASRDIAREVFGEQVKRVIIWSRTQAKNAIMLNMIDVNKFEVSVNKTRNLFDMIDELYDNAGFIVTGIY